jgi:hypothetical protein
MHTFWIIFFVYLVLVIIHPPLMKLKKTKDNRLIVFNFMLISGIILMMVTAKRPMPDPEPTSNARALCRDAVTVSARFPSKVDFVFGSVESGKMANNNFLLRGQVEMMNGFGAMIPHTYECEISSDGQSVLDVRVSK